MTTPETLIQELQDALKREKQFRIAAQGKLALARTPEYEALKELKFTKAEYYRFRKALQEIAGSRIWARVRRIARRALEHQPLPRPSAEEVAAGKGILKNCNLTVDQYLALKRGEKP